MGRMACRLALYKSNANEAYPCSRKLSCRLKHWSAMFQGLLLYEQCMHSQDSTRSGESAWNLYEPYVLVPKVVDPNSEFCAIRRINQTRSKLLNRFLLPHGWIFVESSIKDCTYLYISHRYLIACCPQVSSWSIWENCSSPWHILLLQSHPTMV